jgi:hypothetical protein
LRDQDATITGGHLGEEKTAGTPKRRETTVPIQHNYDYQSTYQQALQVNWQAEYIIGEGTLWIARGQCIEQYGRGRPATPWSP